MARETSSSRGGGGGSPDAAAIGFLSTRLGPGVAPEVDGADKFREFWELFRRRTRRRVTSSNFSILVFVLFGARGEGGRGPSASVVLLLLRERAKGGTFFLCLR